MPYQPGDIVFYPPANAYMGMVARATGGAFAHCEICEDGAHSIGALGQPGVVRHPIPGGGVVVPTGALLASDPVRLSRAIAFAQRRIGSAYSWLDIAADGVQAVLGHATPFLVAPSAMDCSQLAALFLIVAGWDLPDAIVLNPALVSPNGLYRALVPGQGHG